MKKSQDSVYFANADAIPGADEPDGRGEISKIRGRTRTYISGGSSDGSGGSVSSVRVPRPAERKMVQDLLRSLQGISQSIEKDTTAFSLWRRNSSCSRKKIEDVEGLNLEKKRIERIRTAQEELSSTWLILSEKYEKNAKLNNSALIKAREHCYLALSQLKELFLLRNITLEGRIALLKKMNATANAVFDIYQLEESAVGYTLSRTPANSRYISRVSRAKDMLLYSLKRSSRVEHSEYGPLLKEAALCLLPLTKLLSKDIPDIEKNNIYLLLPFGLRCVIGAIDKGTVTGFSTPSETLDIKNTRGQPHSIVASLAAQFLIKTLEAFDDPTSENREAYSVQISDIAFVQMYLFECIMLTKRASSSCKADKLHALKEPLKEIKKHLAAALESSIHELDDITKCYITLKLKQVCRTLAVDCNTSPPEALQRDTDVLLEKMSICTQRCLDRIDTARKLYDHNWTRRNIALPLFPGERPPEREVLLSYEITSHKALQSAFSTEQQASFSANKKKSSSSSILSRLFSGTTQEYKSTKKESKKRSSGESNATLSHSPQKKPAARFGPLPPLPDDKQHDSNPLFLADRSNKLNTAEGQQCRAPTSADIQFWNTHHDNRSQNYGSGSSTSGDVSSNSDFYLSMNEMANCEPGRYGHTLAQTTATNHAPIYQSIAGMQHFTTLSGTTCLGRPRCLTPAYTGSTNISCVHNFHKGMDGGKASRGSVAFTKPASSISSDTVQTGRNLHASSGVGHSNQGVDNQEFTEYANTTTSAGSAIKKSSPSLLVEHNNTTLIHTNTTFSSKVTVANPSYAAPIIKSAGPNYETNHSVNSDPKTLASTSDTSGIYQNALTHTGSLQQAVNAAITRREQRSISETITDTSPEVAMIKNEATYGRSRSLEITRRESDTLYGMYVNQEALRPIYDTVPTSMQSKTWRSLKGTPQHHHPRLFSATALNNTADTPVNLSVRSTTQTFENTSDKKAGAQGDWPSTQQSGLLDIYDIPKQVSAARSSGELLRPREAHSGIPAIAKHQSAEMNAPQSIDLGASVPLGPVGTMNQGVPSHANSVSEGNDNYLTNMYENVRCHGGENIYNAGRAYSNIATPYAITKIAAGHLGNHPNHQRDLQFHDAMCGITMAESHTRARPRRYNSAVMNQYLTQCGTPMSFGGYSTGQYYPNTFMDAGIPAAPLNYAVIYAPTQGNMEAAERRPQNSIPGALHVGDSTQYLLNHHLSQGMPFTKQWNVSTSTSRAVYTIPEARTFHHREKKQSFSIAKPKPRYISQLPPLIEGKEEGHMTSLASTSSMHNTAQHTTLHGRKLPTPYGNAAASSCSSKSLEYKEQQTHPIGLYYTVSQHEQVVISTNSNTATPHPCKHKMPAMVDERKYYQRPKMRRIPMTRFQNNTRDNTMTQTCTRTSMSSNMYESIGHKLNCLSITEHASNERESPKKS